MSTSSPRPLVLIAEGNDDARAMLVLLLDAAGYDTAECDGGDGCIAHVQRLAPDVLLLSTNGWGDTLRIASTVRDREATRGTRVVLISGHGDPEYRQRALEAGCSACLLKPVDVNQLVSEISRLTVSAPAAPGPAEPRRRSADARRFVQDCCSSIESARAALDRARLVSTRAEKQVERANNLLLRIGHHPVGAHRR